MPNGERSISRKIEEKIFRKKPESERKESFEEKGEELDAKDTKGVFDFLKQKETEATNRFCIARDRGDSGWKKLRNEACSFSKAKESFLKGDWKDRNLVKRLEETLLRKEKEKRDELRDYRRKFPDDDTSFKIQQELEETIVNKNDWLRMLKSTSASEEKISEVLGLGKKEGGKEEGKERIEK